MLENIARDYIVDNCIRIQCIVANSDNVIKRLRPDKVTSTLSFDS